jgi:hypothetical protein
MGCHLSIRFILPSNRLDVGQVYQPISFQLYPTCCVDLANSVNEEVPAAPNLQANPSLGIAHQPIAPLVTSIGMPLFLVLPPLITRPLILLTRRAWVPDAGTGGLRGIWFTAS